MAEKKKEISQAIIEMANSQSCNMVSYVGYVNGYGHIFSIWAEDENGIPIPLGLPQFIIQNKSNIKLFNDENFKLSDLLYS